MTLLRDALDRVLREPRCARRWHGLSLAWLETRDEAARKPVRDILEAMPVDDVNADILRLTFLAGASGESRFEDAASARALAEPTDPDRLAAFMAYRWLGALQYLESRAHFSDDLIRGLVPEMAVRQMRHASELLPSDFPPRVPQDVQRIAVVVPYVGHQFHTPSMMAVEQAAVLAREGRQVQIFSAQELVPPDVSLFRGDGRALVLPPLNVQAWQGILPPNVGMTVSDARFSLPGRWRNLMPALASFDPDVVFLVGLYSPLAAALYTVRPIVGMNVHTVAPIAPLDVWLSGEPVPERREVWRGAFPPPLPVFHPWRTKRSGKQWGVTRADLGLSDTAVVWITAGFRLEHEVRGEWASRMLRLMDAYPNVAWLLVGGDGTPPQALRQAPPGRVRTLATRNDLPGILRNCDIYVNPPRMGGGLSVAEAMAEGLPVLALAGSDGGDKLGELARPDLGAYIEHLAALTEDPGLRKAMGAALRRRFDEYLDLDASGPALLAACRQAASLAAERLTGPS